MKVEDRTMVAGHSFDLTGSAAKAARSTWRLSANLRWLHTTTVAVTIDSDGFAFAHDMHKESFHVLSSD
jgi:hypothetical protein